MIRSQHAHFATRDLPDRLNKRQETRRKHPIIIRHQKMGHSVPLSGVFAASCSNSIQQQALALPRLRLLPEQESR